MLGSMIYSYLSYTVSVLYRACGMVSFGFNRRSHGIVDSIQLFVLDYFAHYTIGFTIT